MTRADQERPHVEGFSCFDTPMGVCGIAWSPGGVVGVVGVQLPERDPGVTHARMHDRFPTSDESAPPPEMLKAIVAIVAALSGDAIDLSSVRLDMTGVPPFHRRVYEVVRTIRVGETLTYGEVAADLGAPRSARAVGQALGRNPFAIVVPCHRVLGAGGRIGGFSAHGGVRTKRELLELEGISPS